MNIASIIVIFRGESQSVIQGKCKGEGAQHAQSLLKEAGRVTVKTGFASQSGLETDQSSRTQNQTP